MSPRHVGLPCALVSLLLTLGCQTTRPAVPSAGRLLPRLPALPTAGSVLAKGTTPPKSPREVAQASTPASPKDELVKPVRAQDSGAPDVVVRATVPQTPPMPPPPIAEGPKPPAPAPPSKPAEVPPLPGQPPTPPTSQAGPNDLDKLRDLHRLATMRYEQINDYVARFRCREVVNGKQMKPEIVALRFKKNPDSRHMKWLKGAASEGREVIYVRGKFNNQLQVRTGKSDPIAGLRIEVDPQSPRATANSRRTLDDSGIGKLIERFDAVLASVEQGQQNFGPLSYAGPQSRPECPGQPMECVLQEVPPGREKQLPGGGKRLWFFINNPGSNDHGLPTLIVTEDELGREVEYYCYDLVNTNVGLRDDDFDPARVWKK